MRAVALQLFVALAVDIDLCLFAAFVFKGDGLVVRGEEVAALRERRLLVRVLHVYLALHNIQEGLDPISADAGIFSARVRRDKIIGEGRAHLRRGQDRNVAVFIARDPVFNQTVYLQQNEIVLFYDRPGRKKLLPVALLSIQITHS